MSASEFAPGQVYAVFPKTVSRAAIVQIVEIERNLRILRWRDPWISDDLYAVVITVAEGEETYWVDRLAGFKEVSATGLVRTGEDA